PASEGAQTCYDSRRIGGYRVVIVAYAVYLADKLYPMLHSRKSSRYGADRIYADISPDGGYGCKVIFNIVLARNPYTFSLYYLYYLPAVIVAKHPVRVEIRAYLYLM